MKFDFCIGNPPYQEESNGENQNLSMPVYNKFLDAASEVADVVEMIHPARFLTGVGRTPAEFTERKLNDEHFKILQFESDASKIFPNTDIKGGVVISLENKNKNYGKIGTFISQNELKDIFDKVCKNINVNSVSIFDLVTPRLYFRYTDQLFTDFPKLDSNNGSLHAIQSDAFDKNTFIFHEKKEEEDIGFIGKIKGNRDRVWRYVNKRYVADNSVIDAWKIVMPRSSGNGVFGEPLTQPTITEPQTGMTDTFICVGPLNTKDEADAALKYIKTKFARAMLSILKNTQGNTRTVWKYVPLQDFTVQSDIDWSKSIYEIDQQLYKKYGLSQEEIDFIETNVKEME